MSFICLDTPSNHTGWHVGFIKGTGNLEVVETVGTKQEAFQICNYLNGGMPLEGMNVLNRLTGLKLVSKSKGEK